MDPGQANARYDENSSLRSFGSFEAEASTPARSHHQAVSNSHRSHAAVAPITSPSLTGSDRSVGEGVFVVSRKGPSWLSERQFNKLGDKLGSRKSWRMGPQMGARHERPHSPLCSLQQDDERANAEVKARYSESSDGQSTSSAQNWHILPNENRKRELRGSKMFLMDRNSTSPSISIAVVPSAQLSESETASFSRPGSSFFLQRFYDPCVDDEEDEEQATERPHAQIAQTPKEELSHERVYQRQPARRRSFFQAFEVERPAESVDIDANDGDAVGCNSNHSSLLTSSLREATESDLLEDERHWRSPSQASNGSATSTASPNVMSSNDSVTRRAGWTSFDTCFRDSLNSTTFRIERKASFSNHARPLVLPQVTTVAASLRPHNKPVGSFASPRRAKFHLADRGALSPGRFSEPLNAHAVSSHSTLSRVKSQQAAQDRWSDRSCSEGECESENPVSALVAVTAAEVKLVKKTISRTDALLIVGKKSSATFVSPVSPARQLACIGTQTDKELTNRGNVSVSLTSRRARPHLTIITSNAETATIPEVRKATSDVLDQGLLADESSPKARSHKASLIPACCPECGHTFNQVIDQEKYTLLNLSSPPPPHSARQLAEARIEARTALRQNAATSILSKGSVRREPDRLLIPNGEHNPLHDSTKPTSRGPSTEGAPESLSATLKPSVVEEAPRIDDGQHSTDSGSLHRNRTPSLARKASQESFSSFDFSVRGMSSGAKMVEALKSRLSDVNLPSLLRKGRMHSESADLSAASMSSDRSPEPNHGAAASRVAFESGSSVFAPRLPIVGSGKGTPGQDVGIARDHEEIRDLRVSSDLGVHLGQSSVYGSHPSYAVTMASANALGSKARRDLVAIPQSGPNGHAGPIKRLIDTEVCPWEAEDAAPTIRKMVLESYVEVDSDDDSQLLPRTPANNNAKALKLLGLSEGSNDSVPFTPGLANQKMGKTSNKKDKGNQKEGPGPMARRLSSSNISGPYNVVHVRGSSNSDGPVHPLPIIKPHKSSLDLPSLAASSAENVTLSAPGNSNSLALRRVRQAWKKRNSSGLGAIDLAVGRSLPPTPMPPSGVWTALPSTEASDAPLPPLPPSLPSPPPYRLPSLDLLSSSDCSRATGASSFGLFGDVPLLEALESTAAAALALSQADQRPGAQVVIEIQSSPRVSGPNAVTSAMTASAGEAEKELQLAAKRKREQEAFKRSSSAWNPRADYL